MARRITKLQFAKSIKEIQARIDAGRSAFKNDTPAKKKVRIERARSDQEFFNRTYLPHWFDLPSAGFHRKIIKALQSFLRLAIAAPRDHAKSTVITFATPIHRICFGLEKFIIIVGANEDNAEDFTADIREELRTNEKIKADFGALVGRGGSDGDFVTENGIRIKALGRRQKVRGLKHKHWRPTLVILDDAEDDEAVESEKERRKTDKWLRRAVLNSISKTGQLVWVGTILHRQAQLARLLSKDDFPTFEKLFFQAWVDEDWTVPLWPERYSAADLRHKELEIGSISFLQEQMNIPPDEDTQWFREEWFQYYDDLPPDADECYGSCDSSLGKTDKSDRSAIMDAYINKRGTIYLAEADIRRRRPEEIIESLHEHFDRHPKMAAQFVEADGWQELILMLASVIGAIKRIYAPVVPISHEGVAKRVRIRRSSPLVQNGTIKFHRSLKDSPFIKELIMWNEGATLDDGGDALEMLVRGIRSGLAFKPAYHPVQHRRMKGGERGGEKKFSMRPPDRTAKRAGSADKLREY